MNDKKKSEIIERCLAAVQSGEWTREDCFRRYPKLAHELQDYFVLSERITNSLPLDFEMNELRESKLKMLNHLSDRKDLVTKSDPSRFKWQTTKWRFAMTWVIIITTLLSVLTGTGVVYASGDALPGEGLYSVKLFMEDFQLALAPEMADAQLQLRFSENRLEEMNELIEKGRVDDLDDAVEGYQNQARALTRLIEEIQAKNSDDAVRLRTASEQKLQEQAQVMQSWLDEDLNSNGDQVTEQIQLMLQTNTQTRLRIHESDQIVIPDGTLEEENSEVETTEPGDEATAEPAGNAEQARSSAFVNASGDIQNAAFIFRVANAERMGVYAELAGDRYACAAEGDLVTCNIPNAAANGTLNLYSLADNSLLYSHDYDYDWLGEKWTGEENGFQVQGEGEGGSQGNGQGGKGGK